MLSKQSIAKIIFRKYLLSKLGSNKPSAKGYSLIVSVLTIKMVMKWQVVLAQKKHCFQTLTVIILGNNRQVFTF